MPKTNKRVSTRDAVIAKLRENPQWSFAALARELGVSRERVRQLADSEGIQQPRVKRAYKHESRVVVDGEGAPLNAVTNGTIGELLAAADLMARGYAVFWPLTRQTKCDLVITSKDGTRVERIEVRCARANGDHVAFHPKDNPIHERYALIVTGKPVQYVPPFD